MVSRHVEDSGGLRVRIHVDEHTRSIATASMHEETHFDRVPIGRQVDAPQAPWHDGDVLVVPIYEEVVVVERRLVLKEELRLSKRRVDVEEVHDVPLRREQIIVERQLPDGHWQRVDDTSV